MSFFDQPDVEDFSNTHIEQALKFEEAEAKKILKKFQDARHELRDRLDALPEATFTAQHVRGALHQVESVVQALESVLSDEMRSSSESVAAEGLDHLLREIRRWDKVFAGAVTPINLDVVRISTDTSNFLFNQYESSIESYGQLLRARIANGLTQAAIEEVPWSQVVTKLSKTFLGEEWKLHRIVRTELHNVYNIGKINGMKDLLENYLPDLKKTLFHPMDSRTAADSKALNRNNPIVPIDKPFRFKWQGEERVFMAPPDRPNDRAILIPFRQSWSD